MRISVVILCYNEAERIHECLSSLEGQQYPRDDFEVLVLDNRSTDMTVEIAEGFARRLENVRVLENPRRGIAPGRNLGLREAAHPYVAFTDADCRVPPDWLATLAEGFRRNSGKHPSLAAVGGTNRAPAGVSGFYDAVNVMLKTTLGNRGSTQGREFGRDTRVDHIPTLNILYRKESVLAQGGFDEAFLFVCEDPDLNYRLEAAGHAIVHLDGCPVEHAFVPGWRAWTNKIFRYGKGRTQLLRKHPRKMGPVYLVPPLICLVWLLALASPLFGASLSLPLGLYLAAMGGYALLHCLLQGSLGLWPRVLGLYLLTHVSFGLGQIAGLFTAKARGSAARQ